ncbi:MAG: transcriptional repressor [Spirochaetota bacterium]
MQHESESGTLLVGAGLRPTTIRERVLALLLEVGGALSHRDLAERLSDLDRVSIFRTLKHLRHAGLIHDVWGGDGILRHVGNNVEGEACPGGHPHFFCETCGTLSCLPGQVFPHVPLPSGYSARGKQLLVYGSCPRCHSESAVPGAEA